jgi:hypothetical protein
MKRIIYFAIVAGAAYVLAFVRCSSMGAGSETTNSLTGAIVRSNGPGSNAIVRLLPSSYDYLRGSGSSRLLTDTTDAQGMYRFDAVAAGTYNIEAVGIADGYRALVCGVQVADDATAPTEILQLPGAIKIPLPAGFDTVNGYVYIPGTTMSAMVEKGKDSITLDSVPAGTLPSIVYSATTGTSVPHVIKDSVVVTPGGTTVVAFRDFKLSKKLYLNTTSSGADIAGRVAQFPVLIRLTGNNFDFSQAKGNGSDLRFTNQKGIVLPLEIERWDSAAGQAALWVKVDTVFGNSDSQYIEMYWGKADATGASNSTRVFDAAGGYVGVWHQNQGLADATVNGDNGLDSSTSDGVGIIGRCRVFNPMHRSFITIPNESLFDMTSDITLSAWAKIDTCVYNWQTIIAKGDNAYRLHCDSNTNNACFSISTADTVDYGYNDLMGTSPVNDHAWHFVCGVFDGFIMRTYIDGRLEGERIVNMPCTTNNYKLTIGDNRQRTPRYFAGSIDEVRVMHAAMGADFVKLSYMNQKEPDALVVFK